MRNRLLSLLSILALFASLNARAQGVISFYNNAIPTANGAGTYRAGVFRMDGTGAGAGHSAGLFRVRPDGRSELLATTSFRVNNNFEVFLGPQNAVVNGVPPGSSGVFVVRAWANSSGPLLDPETLHCCEKGQSNPFRSLPLGDPVNFNQFPTPDLTGLEPLYFYGPGPPIPSANQTFESRFPANQLGVIPAGSDDLPFGRIDSPVDYVQTALQLQPGDRMLPGSYAIDLGKAEAPGQISKFYILNPDENRLLRSHLSGNPEPAPGPTAKILRVTVVGEASYDTAVEQNTLANMKWRTIYVSLPRGRGEQEVRFSAASPGESGPVIDSSSYYGAGSIAVSPFPYPDRSFRPPRVAWLDRLPIPDPTQNRSQRELGKRRSHPRHQRANHLL